MSGYALLYDSTGEALLIALDTDIHLLTQAEAEAFEKNANEFVIHRVRVATPHQNDSRLKHALETGAACARQFLQAQALAQDPQGVFVWWTFETARPIEDESAGLLGACAFAVARLHQVQPGFAPVAFAATGRVSPSGRVQRVAHLPEKLRAALTATPPLRLVLYPKEQAADVQELAEQADHRGILFCPVATVEEALGILLRMGNPAASVLRTEDAALVVPILAQAHDWTEETSSAPEPTPRRVLSIRLGLLLVGFSLGVLLAVLVERWIGSPPTLPQTLPPSPVWNSLGMEFRWPSLQDVSDQITLRASR